MSKSENINPNPNVKAYADTFNAITMIPQQLISIFTDQNVVDCLKEQQYLDLNNWPFMFSEENNHIWQVLEALE